MRVLQVISSFPPAYSYGGALKVAYEVSKELVKKGHEVTVFTTDVLNAHSRFKYDKNPIWMYGIEVYHFKNISNFLARNNFATSPMMAFALNRTIKDFDIIHLHEYRSFQAIFTYYYAQKYRVPYILQTHGSVLPFFQKQRLKKIFDIFFGYKILRNAKKVIAVSKTEVEQYKRMGIYENKITVIPNVINVNSFINLPEKGTFRNQFGISEKHIILFLGRLHEIKGIDFLIKSFAELKNEMEDVVLILAGSDDGYKAKAEMLIEELKLTNHVKFTGHIHDVNKVYMDADVLVYPSIFEIFGLVPFEAIMCGTPVIVTDDCGCGELVRDANCGYLVKYGDIKDLKEKMKLIIENPEERKEMVTRGRKYIEENLEMDKVIQNIIMQYKDCIDTNKLSEGKTDGK